MDFGRSPGSSGLPPGRNARSGRSAASRISVHVSDVSGPNSCTPSISSSGMHSFISYNLPSPDTIPKGCQRKEDTKNLPGLPKVPPVEGKGLATIAKREESPVNTLKDAICPNETNNGEPGASQDESSQPTQPEAKPAEGASDPVDPSNFNNAQAQPSPPAASNPPPPPPPPTSNPSTQPPPQTSPPNAGSPPHPTQLAQPPPPMAIYPPPPGYAYPPQLYPGMPFPAPGPDPNAPYAHFVGMQYAQPYGPYMWAAPPPPPGHEQAPAAHVGEQDEGERDADGKLKIKRTFQACQKCRQRKAKCNGARPSCQHCASRGLVCEYAKERSKPRGTNGEEGDEILDSQSTEAPTTMDPTQAMVPTASSPANPNQQVAPGAPPVPATAPPNMFPPPFPYDPNAYNPHVDPHQHGGQPMYPFPPYGYGHPPGFGSIAGPPLVHIGEEGAVPPYHTAVPPPAVIPGPPPSNSPPSGSSKRPRTIRPPGAQGMGKSRIFQACERCRERKAKCDGVRPICTHCATRDLNCEWADKRRMRGPAKGITPRRTRQENNKYITQENIDVNMSMQAMPLGLNAAELQQIEPHASTASERKRKRRSSHSSGSPSPSESSSSSDSSPSESDDDDADRNSTMGIGAGVVSSGWRSRVSESHLQGTPRVLKQILSKAKRLTHIKVSAYTFSQKCPKLYYLSISSYSPNIPANFSGPYGTLGPLHTEMMTVATCATVLRLFFYFLLQMEPSGDVATGKSGGCLEFSFSNMLFATHLLTAFVVAVGFFGSAATAPVQNTTTHGLVARGPYDTHNGWTTPPQGSVHAQDYEWVAAVGTQLFQELIPDGNPNHSAACGKTATATWNGKSITLGIVDRCPGCGYNDIDLAPAAFQQFADLG
ncbi:fungal zn(2)-Cys(6) binuclear cluster domain-containing protein [Rhizoctonia solani AG-1 IA]|uniref:Fungal zn(2)-Cys(6) binuclear cluster domain-containing protein n=1 Tax=Thanatephorus cucumeris (strain AG1-IA) TaxID=983506 RepID=L8X4B1_THACA|nr:fungal zn(2)-Cys(6) binuclear cluster domain-containing protein [Rhizoctonia solani AG-1 IA]